MSETERYLTRKKNSLFQIIQIELQVAVGGCYFQRMPPVVIGRFLEVQLQGQSYKLANPVLFNHMARE